MASRGAELTQDPSEHVSKKDEEGGEEEPVLEPSELVLQNQVELAQDPSEHVPKKEEEELVPEPSELVLQNQVEDHKIWPRADVLK